MKRIEVVERAAATLRAQHPATSAAGGAQVEQLCAALGFELQARPGNDVMLGGAYSRLQLWDWADSKLGGIIWLREDLDRETRHFAIAHELGHFALHRGEGVNLHAACDQQAVDQQADLGNLRVEERTVEEYSPRVRRELEASAFAAELLAPRAEARRIFTSDAGVDTARLAAHFGISRQLAERRLIDAVLASSRPKAHTSAEAATAPAGEGETPKPGALLARLDDWQRQAARAQGPALVVAGPGTGKTATLVGRVAYLIEERHIPPERTLALTFSNRAAGEMRERLAASGLPGERMPIMTIHAFAVTLLREYASRAPHAPDEAELKPDFRILDEANAYLLMEELLGELPLRYYRSLGNPAAHLRALLNDFSHARDELLSPADYAALVSRMPLAPTQEDTNDQAPDAETVERQAAAKKCRGKKPQPPEGTFTREQIERARERAEAYAVWDRALRRRGLLDFGSLIQRAVELLRADPMALAEVRRRYPEMLVDEFQDTNRAAAELLMLVAGETGHGLWVVGDHNQSIYRFRGASPGNLPRLVRRYPGLRVFTLQRCYRATPDIVALGSAMAARMGELSPVAVDDGGAPSEALRVVMRPLALESVRAEGAHPAIQRAEDFASAAHERVGLAAAIQRFHALGYAYSDQAILCRTHKQTRRIAAVLARQGVPVSQLGDFFERAEIKDALMLLFLAAGPDTRGLLRGASLLIGLGYPPPSGSELADAAHALSSRRRGQRTLSAALRDRAALSNVASLSPTTRAGLAALGEVTMDLQNGPPIGHKLAAFLLRPGGYAWRLARVADGLDAPHVQPPLPGMESAAHAQQALAALGELARLAWRFDIRWATEPEFQARLIRAVTRRKAARPAEPDSLTPAPGADVAPSAVPSSTDTSGARAQPAEPAAAVRGFLHYLHALRASDVVIPVPAGEEDAAQALTLHQSKGLEFPVVLLPGLAHGQFPASAHGREEVSPPGFRDADAPGEREAEERCLFYVGVTRARDVVALTRARSYGKGTGGAPRTTERSSLLALLDDAPGWEHAAPLLSDEERASLLAVAATFEDSEDGESEDEGELAPRTEQPSTTEAAREMARRQVFPLHDLEQYLSCPRQYKYAHQYHLFDLAEDAVYRFYRYVRRGAHELRDMRAASPGADWQTVEAHLRSLWEEVGATGHAYDAFYWQVAEEVLRGEWQEIIAPESGVVAERRLLAQPLQARLRHCAVEVTADREIDRFSPTSDDNGPASDTTLIRLHTGRPNDQHKKDLALPLYYLAHQQQHPGVPVRVILGYTGRSLSGSDSDADNNNDDDTGDDDGASTRDGWMDVTGEARAVVEKYLDPTRKRRSTLDKLDEAALGIASGQFAPRPEERRCAACAYCYVCPSDPDSHSPVPAPIATTAKAPIQTSS